MNPQVIGTPMSAIYILGCTRKLREAVGYEDELFFPITKFVETVLPLADDTFNYCYCEESELPNEYAHYNPSTNTISIRQDVYDRAVKKNGRDRFTIAHEVGHYYLHDKSVRFSRISNGVAPIFCDVEWQANTFASFLLMEPRLICGMTPDLIASKCGTSQQAAKVALSKISQAPNLTY